MPICKYEEFLSLIKSKNRILGIDHGTKNIGVAISDENLILSLPLTTVRRSKEKLLSNITINKDLYSLIFLNQ